MTFRDCAAVALIAAVTVAAAPGCSREGTDDPNEYAPRKQRPPITRLWKDSFDRKVLGDDYNATSQAYTLVDGALTVSGAYNHPLWLRRRLPRDVVVEFDAWSKSPEGDIKVELFGDGRYFDPDRGSYVGTGYIFAFGGWKNTKSIIARRDEHGKDVTVDPTHKKVVANKRYHWSITRKGQTITWMIDGAKFLEYNDTSPLEGEGHQFMAFNNWEVELGFDNLQISPAK